MRRPEPSCTASRAWLRRPWLVPEPGRMCSVCAALSRRSSSQKVRPFQSAVGSVGGLPCPSGSRGEEAGEFAVEPAGEVAHGRVEVDQGDLGQALHPEVCQGGLGRRYKPCRGRGQPSLRNTSD
jgi:hypothetical protein